MTGVSILGQPEEPMDNPNKWSTTLKKEENSSRQILVRMKMVCKAIRTALGI
jgi:hypothetical protein